MTVPTTDLRSVLPEPAVVAVLRTATAGRALEMADALISGGVTVLEVTTSIPGAAGVVGELVGDDRLVVGAGTVTDLEQLETMLEAGARFVVSPGLAGDVLTAGLAHGIPVIPGVLTPSEVISATRLGATTVKLFPAGTVGPAHLAALTSVFPDVGFVPTGGVDASNLARWLDAGSVAIGVGSVLEKVFEQHGARGLKALAGELVSLTVTATGSAHTQKENVG